MSDAKQPVKVTIFHQNYTLLSQGDPNEVLQVAREVDELMHSIAERAGSSDSARIAVLACLHLADRMRALEAAQNRISNRASQIQAMLEQVIEG